ncbi:hypothetical protein Ciccas_007341 [Cichlidogyrus casuarinus]|uniref:Uncharacterized protein n=1 Tax=Cichlidogyrus casuarinus TaxID=1844966 RepID=A0ABD2Q3I2_9PLAT
MKLFQLTQLLTCLESPDDQRPFLDLVDFTTNFCANALELRRLCAELVMASQVEHRNKLQSLLKQLPALVGKTEDNLQSALYQVYERDFPIAFERLKQSIIHLKSWLLNMNNSVQEQLALASSSSEPDGGMSKSLAGFERALTELELSILEEDNSYGRRFKTITFSILEDQTYISCRARLNDYLGQLTQHLHAIPSRLKTPTDVVHEAKALTSLTSELLPLSKHCAYLLAAANPASKPGRAGNMSREETFKLQEFKRRLDKLSQDAFRVEENNPPMDKISSHMRELEEIRINLEDLAERMVCTGSFENHLMENHLREMNSSVDILKSYLEDKMVAVESQGALLTHLGEARKSCTYLTDALLKAAKGVPCKVDLITAAELQPPVLESWLHISRNTRKMLAQLSSPPSNNQEIENTADRILQGSASLNKHICNHLPGQTMVQESQLKLHEMLQRLNERADQVVDSTASREETTRTLESWLPTITNALGQLSLKAGRVAKLWNMDHWELVAHELHQMSKPDFENVLEKSLLIGPRLRTTDQVKVTDSLRRILTSLTELNHNIKDGFTLPESKSKVDATSRQLQAECEQYLNLLEEIGCSQGGIATHISTIRHAMKKLHVLSGTGDYLTKVCISTRYEHENKSNRFEPNFSFSVELECILPEHGSNSVIHSDSSGFEKSEA